MKLSDVTPDDISPDINPDDFATECLSAARIHGVSPHYLITVANYETDGIKNIPSKTAGSDAFGPFQITNEVWSTEAPPLGFTGDDRVDPFAQCYVAAKITAAANDGLKVVMPGQNPPTGAELYCSRLFGLTGATKILGSGRDRSQSIKDALGDVLAPDKIAPFMDANATLLKTKEGTPNTIQQVIDAIVAALDPSLKVAVTLINKVAPGLFDPPPSTSGTFGSPPPSGKPLEVFQAKAPAVMRKLMSDFGFSDFQAGGILGNLGHECNGFTQLQEIRPLGGGRGGLGWAQWTGPRRKLFEQFCADNHFDTSSDDGNYGYLKKDLGDQPKTVAAIKGAGNLSDATLVFEQKFEIAGVVNMDSRNKWAQRAMDAFRTGGG
jgi:hypothetical protein